MSDLSRRGERTRITTDDSRFLVKELSSHPLCSEEDLMALLRPGEVAKWLGVSVSWVRDHSTRKSPRLPTVKAGKLLRYRPVDVKEFIRCCSRAGDVGGGKRV